MKKKFLSLLILLSFCPAYADWRIEAFDEAQALVQQESEEQKSVILKKYPELSDYYETHIDILTDYRSQLNRMAFLYLLETSPSEINWETINWYIDYRFPETEKEARYRRFIPGYDELRDQLYKHNEQTRQRWQWAQDTQMKDIYAREALKPKLVEINDKYKVLWDALNAKIKKKHSEQRRGR